MTKDFSITRRHLLQGTGALAALSVIGVGPAFAATGPVRFGIYGSAIRRLLHPLASSAWVGDPFARGSYSSALPGHADDRAAFAAPVEHRIFFAGEACSRDQFGTAHAAFTSGVAAAEQAIAALARAKPAA